MDTMRRVPRTEILLLLVVAGATLGGCGSQTKTVSVTGTPPAPQTTATVAPATTSTPSTPTSTPASTTPAQTTSSGGTPSSTSTRAAPEPAFTQQEAGTEGLSAAAAIVRAKGFTPSNASDYHPNQTLRVLLGTRNGSAGAYDEQAFFFVNGRYIGTDSSKASATLSVVSQSDTEVTLAYPLYRSSDPVCCPSGGQARVRFQLNNGKLAALDPIPPASSTTGFSRM
jgi:LppP/LprE lipoprotein